MSVCLLLMLLGEAISPEVAETVPPTLSITVVSPAGVPIEGAHVDVMIDATRRMVHRSFRFAPDVDSACGVTDETGTATIEVSDDRASYIAYVDAGDQGRVLIERLRTDRTHQVPISADPPLQIRLKNLPTPLRERLLIQEVRRANGRAVRIEHEPLVVDPAEPIIELQSPLGEQIMLGLDWEANDRPLFLPRTLHVNARGGGRVAEVDFADPNPVSYVDPSLAPLSRTIRLKFQTVDGEPADVESFEFAGKRFVSIAGMRFLPGHEAKPKALQKLPFLQAGDDWILRAPESEQVSLQLQETRVRDHVLVGDGDRLVPVDTGDSTIDVTYTPTVEYVWADTSKSQKESHYVRFSWASESLGSSTQRLKHQYLTKLSEGLPAIRVPKDEETLLAVEHPTGYSIRLLDGTGGRLSVDEPEFVETTIQAYTADGRLLMTQVEGLLVLGSGITAPLPIETKNDWLHRETSETGFPSTEALLRFACDVPLETVVRSEREPWLYAVVPLAMGKRHDVILKPSRSLTVWLMDETGAAVPLKDVYRVALKWVDEFGLVQSQVETASIVPFKSVPTEGMTELTIMHPSGRESRLEIELPDEDRLAIAIERGSNGAVYLTDWPGVIPTPASQKPERVRVLIQNGIVLPNGIRVPAPNGPIRLPGPNRRGLNIRRPLPAQLPQAPPAYVPKKPIELNPLFIPKSTPVER